MKSSKVVVAPLRLERWLPVKDVRKLIWRYLRQLDILICCIAHNSTFASKTITWRKRHGFDAARDGNIERIEWMIAHGFKWEYIHGYVL